MFAFVFHMAHVFYMKQLINNYIDLRMESIQMAEKVEETQVSFESNFKSLQGDQQYKLIPVYGSRTIKEPVAYTKVSLCDYEFLTGITDRWRMDTHYAVLQYSLPKLDSTVRKVIKKPMHKFLYDRQSTHINGDKLDNRRSNLTPHVPSRSTVNENDFKICTPRVVVEDFHKFKAGEDQLQVFTGYAEIEYETNKFYSGDVQKGIPHGYGHLYEAEKNMQSCGFWVEGKMSRGMVVQFKPYPDCLCDYLKHCPLREVKKVSVVKEGCCF